MRRTDPDCHLSWTTLAAIGSVLSSHRVSASGWPGGSPAAVSTGRRLCAGGRDLATGPGWTGAIRAVRSSDTFLEKVFATVELYGGLLQHGTSIPARAIEAVRFAIDQIGLPYVWGGNGPGQGQSGFDCSGLTSTAYRHAGITLPRTADAQFHSSAAASDPQLGDLVFYGNPRGFVHHVGIYLGDGRMINAPDFGMAVQIGPVRSPGDDYAGVGRPEN